MPAFMIQTLGCKLNQLESEAAADAFLKCGISNDECKIEEGREPSFIVINTCTVTSKADQKARRVIRKALRDYPGARVIVTGCYAQLNKDEILKLETDGMQRLLVIDKDKIIDFIRSLCAPHSASDIPHSSLAASHSKFQFNPEKFSQHTRSFLKIQDGCDKHCTYCRIRLARGPGISLDKEEVLRRLRILEETHAEAVLTGVNICQYKCSEIFNREPSPKGENEKELNLTGLLEYLLNGTEKIAIRLSSLAPDSVDVKLCGILSHQRIQPHFHLSVQSCSDKILERMGRSYNAQTVEKAVSLLRGAKDDPFLACDIIAGFPGETEIEFRQTLKTAEKLDFTWIHAFPYSKRQGTPAFSFSDTVHESDVTKRVQLLTSLARQGRAAYVKRWLGKEVDVLIEEKAGICFGTSRNYLKTLVKCESKKPQAGMIVRCKLEEEGDYKNYDVIARCFT